jgi:hypothetical protein
LEVAFQGFEEVFTSALLLIDFDLRKPSILERDASDFTLGAILLHKDDYGMLHPMAFHSQKF